jgi:hypothetical protein
MERADALGEPAAVLQLLDRHNRDCEAVAKRLGVPRLKVPDVLPDTPFEVIPVVRKPGWKESALWWPERGLLVVPETIGTAPAFTAGKGPVGLHPMLRAKPPGALRGMKPEHLLVGHGQNVHGPEAARGLEQAYARSLRDLPRAVVELVKALF